MNKPLISISFPVYNVSKTVEKSLLSALNQTYPEIEFLIVDDCGIDDSMEIVKSIINNSPRKASVRIIRHKVNKGLGSVRNTSIKYATGKYIYFMDSDDTLESHTIDTLYSFIKGEDYDLIASSHVVRNINGEILNCKGYKEKIDIKGKLSLANYIYNSHKGEFQIYMWNKLFAIEFLRHNDIYCIHPFVEDDFFTFQVALKAKNVCLIPNYTYNYFINEESITNKLMSGDIPLKTGKIYVDISCQKFKRITTIQSSFIRWKILLSTLNETVLRNGLVQDSKIISLKDKSDLATLMFDFKKLSIPIEYNTFKQLSLNELSRILLFYILKYSNSFMKKAVSRFIYLVIIKPKIVKKNG